MRGRGEAQGITHKVVRIVCCLALVVHELVCFLLSSRSLGMKQVEYAAMDAWAGAAVHAELSRRRPDLFAQIKHRVTCPNGIPKKERALKEILDRRIRRRELVAELKELEEEYFVENGGFFMCVDEAVEKEIVKLRIAITSLQHDRFLYFDPKEVGL